MHQQVRCIAGGQLRFFNCILLMSGRIERWLSVLCIPLQQALFAYTSEYRCAV
jgi:hypothetical protein